MQLNVKALESIPTNPKTKQNQKKGQRTVPNEGEWRNRTTLGWEGRPKNIKDIIRVKWGDRTVFVIC